MGRRKNTEGPKWRAGQYIRLSREDMQKSGDDSNSVVHQRALLDEFCSQHADELLSTKAFIDDGCTGTDTDRDGFQRLLADVTAGRINCVIVKDLSRLSRNYSDAGSLIENLFVRLGVRFVSLAEGVDSYLDPDSVSGILIPITNVINDNYCYQTSKKIRQVLDYKRRSGQFIGAFAAYGYQKDPADHGRLIVDPEAAGVVRRIFARYMDGMSKTAIAQGLNGEGVPCPTAYKQAGGMAYRNPGTKPNPLWSAKTVGDILRNRLYTGDMVQGRQRVKSYKVHTQEQVPESRWFVVENTHEAIVDRAVYDRVQTLLVRNTRSPSRGKSPYLFSGLLRCADCGRSMSRSKVGDRVYYYCRTYKDRAKTACTSHALRHTDLEAAVLRVIQLQLYLSVSPQAVLEAVEAAPNDRWESVHPAAGLSAREAELEKIFGYRQSLYQDWKDGEITQEDYRRMRADYDRQLADLRERISQLNIALDRPAQNVSPILAEYTEKHGVSMLSRDLLIELVNEIFVGEHGEITVNFAAGWTFSD